MTLSNLRSSVRLGFLGIFLILITVYCHQNYISYILSCISVNAKDLHLKHCFRITHFSSITNCQRVISNLQIKFFKIYLNNLGNKISKYILEIKEHTWEFSLYISFSAVQIYEIFWLTIICNFSIFYNQLS